ncbi:MAG: glycosyltransferase family 39 protein [Anaerolineae bacterium]
MRITASKPARISLDWSLAALCAILTVGLGLRLYHLGTQSLWYDEAQTLYIAGFPLGEIIQRAYRPPLYHFLLHVWAPLAGGSEFWLRLPSALFGAAIPLLAYGVTTRLYGRRTALCAALLSAFSPVLVWYAQELRMYSLLALEFLALLYVTIRLWEGSPRRPILWVGLWAVQVIALYTHYFAIPFLLWLAGLTTAWLASTRRWRDLRGWLVTELATALAFAPWLLVVLGGRGGTEDYVAAEPVPVVEAAGTVRAFLAQVWRQYSVGNVSVGDGSVLFGPLSLLALTGLGLACLLLLVQAVRTLRPWARREQPAQQAGVERTSTALPESLADLLLLALVIVPGLVATLMFKLRPGVVHPRHMMMISGPLMILLARTAGLAWRSSGEPRLGLGRALAPLGQAAGLSVGIAFLGLFAYGLYALATDSHLQRPDVRSLANEVAASTTAEDIILLPYNDYVFNHYYQGPAEVSFIETRVGDQDLSAWLIPRIQGARRAVLIRWVQVYADPREFLPWLLQCNGRLVSEGWRTERNVRVYELRQPLALPSFFPQELRVGPLDLATVSLPESSPADQPLPVALEWRLSEPAAIDLHASVRLLDSAGVQVAQDDCLLLGEQALVPTSRWNQGLTARNYHLLELPAGTPPGVYQVALSVYEDRGPLDILDEGGAPAGTLRVISTVGIAPALAYPETFPPTVEMEPVGREVVPGLRLEGVHVEPLAPAPGQSVAVTLYWRALSADLPDLPVSLQLTAPNGAAQGDQEGAPAYGSRPFDRWQQGELVVDRRVLRVNPDAEAGEVGLVLAVGGETLRVADLAIAPSDRLYALPDVQHPLDVRFGDVAVLRGYDLAADVIGPGEPLHLTLYWQALGEGSPAVDYHVFTHLLNPANQVVAQHDGAPAGGDWPTTSWLPGQVIVDTHALTLRDDTYTGETVLEVGLYDPTDFRRIPAGNEDRTVLSVIVRVER